MTQQEPKNTISDIRRFFEEGSRPYAQGEFIEFWKSLTQEEKDELQNADLKN